MKIAIIFNGNVNNQKGIFNNVIERINQLKTRNDDLQIDVFLIQYQYSWLFKKLKKINVTFEDTSIVNNIEVKNLWVKLTLVEYLITHRLKLQDVACKRQLKKYVSLFSDFDILSVHGLLDLHLATLVKNKYGTPFVMTWHGSDINVYPFNNKKTFKSVKFFLQNADFNFFVSKQLQKVSDRIKKTDNKSHLYSGPSKNFQKPSLQQKKRLKENIGINSDKLIGFIGNMKPIKNVMALPGIFKNIQDKIYGIGIIIVGDGPLLDSFKKEIIKQRVQNVIFTGKIEPKGIPEIIGALDVLILPSFNEGMPMVVLEAIQSGVHVVGSNVGGIPESIGFENCFNLNDDFEINVSNRVIDIIQKNEPPSKLSSEFSWDSTVQKEIAIYKNIISNYKT
ncbi:glycosyltransferase [Arenibacter latericius]|uniref:glycosyltransferase n=1 Tax=Arenibacter latericius TaxID=86104 RepID=UPI0003FFCC6B|nr:glycosyltransferase [Arenibacter latericius]